MKASGELKASKTGDETGWMEDDLSSAAQGALITYKVRSTEYKIRNEGLCSCQHILSRSAVLSPAVLAMSCP
jgi:hypothetical protein